MMSEDSSSGGFLHVLNYSVERAQKRPLTILDHMRRDSTRLLCNLLRLKEHMPQQQGSHFMLFCGLK